MSRTRCSIRAACVLSLLLASCLGCGRYGAPIRSRPAVRSAPNAAVLSPAKGAIGGAELPTAPDAECEEPEESEESNP